MNYNNEQSERGCYNGCLWLSLVGIIFGIVAIFCLVYSLIHD